MIESTAPAPAHGSTTAAVAQVPRASSSRELARFSFKGAHACWSTWSLIALAVLVLNDHMLKGSALVSPAWTGKLSDFAGLFLAPTLLAVLLRARRRISVAVCHVAVGLVFAAAKISPSAATWICEAAGSLGLNWTIAPDLTDLWALSVMPLAYLAAFSRSPAQTRVAADTRSGPPSVWQPVGLSLQLLFCAASANTSDPNDAPREVSGTLFLHNSTDDELTLRMAALLETVRLDCDLVATDPGSFLTEAVFGDLRSSTLQPEETLGLEDPTIGISSTCNAAWIVDASGEATYLFWDRTRWYDLSQTTVEQLRPTGQLIELATIEGDPSRIDFVDAAGKTAFEPRDQSDVAIPGECGLSPVSARLDWSDDMRNGIFVIADIVEGFDGCLGLELDGSESGLDLNGRVWHICMPFELFQFQRGQRIEIYETSVSDVSGARGTRGLHIQFSPRDEDDEWSSRVELSLSKGSGVVSLAGLSFQPIAEVQCPYSIDSDCGTVSRPSKLYVVSENGTSATLRAGADAVPLSGVGGQTISVVLMHAEHRPVIDSACSLGSLDAGVDLDVVVLRRVAAAQPPAASNSPAREEGDQLR